MRTSLAQAVKRLALALLLFGLTSLRAETQTYTIAPLEMPPGTTLYTTYRVNSSGCVAGAIITPDGQNHAAYWDASHHIHLIGALPGDSSSIAAGINDLGQVVGSSGYLRPFIWDAVNGMVELPKLPGHTLADAREINNSGLVTGSSKPFYESETCNAVSWLNGEITDLGFAPNLISSVTYGGLNSAGHVAAFGNDSSAQSHACLYIPGSGMIDLGISFGVNTYANDVNDFDQVVGGSDTEGVLWQNGVVTLLGTLGGRCLPLAINNSGVIIGLSGVSDGSEHGFVYRDGVITDLNNLIPASSGWLITWASDINDNGQIAGFGYFGGQLVPYLMTPVQGIPTYVTVNNAVGVAGQHVNLTAHVRRSDTNGGISAVTATFKIGSTVIGTDVTNGSGSAVINYVLPESAGTYTITVEFAGDETYAASAGGGSLEVDQASTYITVTSKIGDVGQAVTLAGRLRRDVNNSGVGGKTVRFFVDSNEVGSDVTGNDGTAQFKYDSLTTVGDHAVELRWDGDASYSAASGNGTLTVTKASTALTVPTVSGKIGNTVNITARLRRTSDGTYLAGESVNLSVAGTFIGTAITDSTGRATIAYTIPGSLGTGAKVITAEFAGSSLYYQCVDTGTLNVK